MNKIQIGDRIGAQTVRGFVVGDVQIITSDGFWMCTLLGRGGSVFVNDDDAMSIIAKVSAK